MRQQPMGRWLVITLVLALAGAALAPAVPATGQDGFDELVLLPVALESFSGSFPAPRQVEGPTATGLPTAAPSDTPGPTATGTPRPPTAPPPTPTRRGGLVNYPQSPGTVILQIGYTDTDEISETWEEMNGTPWLTLYGDGRLLAGDRLPNREQPLFESQVPEDVIQDWLQVLTYDIGFFRLSTTYQHSRAAKPHLHVYANTTGGGRRVTVKGFINWEREPTNHPDEPGAVYIKPLLDFVRTIEERLVAEERPPYDVERYTVLSQRIQPLSADPPSWRGSLNVRSIAEAAPTAASNYEDKLVGHKFVTKTVGEEVRAEVLPLANSKWIFYNQAAEFKIGGKRYSVGVRKEVPGGTLFLPADKKSRWYRRDPGSGNPPFAGPIEPRLTWPRPIGWSAPARGVTISRPLARAGPR